ncbi:hypothetical protein Tco_0372550, partial [Tanacetum coccineum]
EVDIIKKTENQAKNDKTEHEMEKTVQNQGQSPKMSKSESIFGAVAGEAFATISIQL